MRQEKRVGQTRTLLRAILLNIHNRSDAAGRISNPDDDG
jgi:hypothetical protein